MHYLEVAERNAEFRAKFAEFVAKIRMKKQNPQLPSGPTLASLEGDLFGALMGFHMKTMTLLRESSLNDEKRKLVGDRLNSLIADATAEIKQAQQVNLTERLEGIYGEVKRLIEELTGHSDGSRNG